MTGPGAPAPGEMQLYDAVVGPLQGGLYQLQFETKIGDGGQYPLPAGSSFLAIEGPRFALPASEVSAVHPPRNALGTFDQVLPHIVLGRRTLPWERALDPQNLIEVPPPEVGEPEPRPLVAPVTPWLALLVFTEDPGAPEAKIVTGVEMQTVVTDPAIRARLAVSATLKVDAVEAPGPLIRRLLPTKEEATLLCHARRVNVDDRELAAGDTDGWFAVVMANRLPAPGHRHRCCLVSLEQRTDLVPAVPWRAGDAVPAAPATARLVLLHSWTFTADAPVAGTGSFRELAVGLHAGPAGCGAPARDDTGHIRMTLHDRTGSEQTVHYRGPLTPRPIDRDPLGPYHSADQARRVSPETGLENINYAAAFELGRLLAAADPRLGQDLMRWRRESYQQSARSDVAASVWTEVPEMVAEPEDALLHGMVAPVAVTMLGRAGTGAGESADTTGARAASAAPGMDAEKLARAWSVTSEEAAALLAGRGRPDDGDPSPATGDDLAIARARMAATATRHAGGPR